MFKHWQDNGNVVQFKRPGILKVILCLLITLVIGAVVFYITLPPINPHTVELYMFIGMLCVIFSVCILISTGNLLVSEPRGFFQVVKKQCLVPVILIGLLVIVFAVGSVSSWVVIRASAYAGLITIEEGNFVEDILPVSYSQIPMLDKASAEKLGDRKLGELSDMVSQFTVSTDYQQINFQNKPVRVTPLLYGDIIKWFNNRREGIPAYIILDMVTQEASVVRLEQGMKYSPSERFGRKLERHLRFNYPTFMFESAVFEVDEDGHPYWICPRVVKTIGLFGGQDIRGAVLVDAVTGQSQYYEDVPTWVDRVYSADLILEQYDYYGSYHNGFFNSILGQRGVTKTTEGYNYIAQNDDVYVYTGITSVTGDESNVGFILTNQRTKQTTYYAIAGATERSAQLSAQGVVQHLNYSATFPLLLNISNQPTYFSPLKDKAELVKMYAMVNVQQYQIVATGSTVAECEAEYNRLLLQNNITVPELAQEFGASGTVEDIRTAVFDGGSYYFIKLAGDPLYYRITASDNQSVVILNAGDEVEILFSGASENGIIDAYGIQVK